jgi:hypothetical protein
MENGRSVSMLTRLDNLATIEDRCSRIVSTLRTTDDEWLILRFITDEADADADGGRVS